MALYMLIKAGAVVNAIIADADFIAATAGTGLYQQAIDVDDLDPKPGIGWTYVDDTFTPPAPPPVPPDMFDPATMTDLGGDSPAIGSAPTGSPA